MSRKADGNAIRDSLANAKATEAFAMERENIRKLLCIEGEDGETIVPRRHDFGVSRSLADIFGALLHMEDHTVLRIIAFVMAETLAAHSETVEALGALFATDMRQWWQADETFFALLRDKEAINGMVRELASDMTADAHITATAKVQKKIIGDCLDGTRAAQVQNWLPRYMAFPAGGYTGRFAGRVTVSESDSEAESKAGDDGDVGTIDPDEADMAIREEHDTDDTE